jgi:D-sedoheptulose 7-phosphate isomerase
MPARRAESNVKPNVAVALRYGKSVGAGVGGPAGRDAGSVPLVVDAWVVILTVNPQHVAMHTEACQVVVWPLLVTHPRLEAAATNHESVR